MEKNQYAVCHLERGNNNESGMSCHIERRTADGKVYVPKNADASRTHLTRELLTFPSGVKNRTEAIQHRLDTAGLTRKVGKNQTRAVRVLLSGSHEHMAKIADEGKVDKWMDANIKWLRDTFGADNVVSCVLHMDEQTPHLHATIVPIVDYERKRRSREGERKYKAKSGPRLSADDVMSRSNLRVYQDSYAKAMACFGLTRGIVGSTAKHTATSDYYKKQMLQCEEDIAKMMAEVEKAQEGKSRILAFFGKGDLAKAKQSLAEKDNRIAELTAEIERLKREKAELQKVHDEKMSNLRSTYKDDIAKRIKEVESCKKIIAERDRTISKQQEKIVKLDHQVNPLRYNLSSGAELAHIFVPNPRTSSPSVHIWTEVDGEQYDTVKYADFYSSLWENYLKGEVTDHELVNELFEPQEQVNEAQANLLGAAFELAIGGQAQVHIGTGSGGSQSQLPWKDKEKRPTRGR